MMNDGFFTEDSKREGVITSIIKRLVEVEKFVVSHLSVPHYPYPVAALVYNNANISIPSGGAGTTLTFNSEVRDNGNLHSTTVNTSRLTAPVNGWYMINVMLGWPVWVAGRRVEWITINAVTVAVNESGSSAINTPRRAIATLQYMTAGQYAEVVVFQDSGGAVNINYAASYSPYFGMALIK